MRRRNTKMTNGDEGQWTDRFRVLAMIALLLVATIRPTPAQEMPVPIEIQGPLLLKVLKYDKTLEQRATDELVIGILFQEKFRDSLNARDGFVEAIGKARLSEFLGRPTRLVNLVDVTEVGATLEAEGVDVLYVSPLRAASLASIVEAADAHNTLTLSGVLDYVENGVMVGVTERRGRPAILLNLSAASVAGITFSSELVRVAQIVGR